MLFCLAIQSNAQSWQTHEVGPNGAVAAIASSGTRVYIGGDFTSVTNPPSTSVPGSSYLAVWTGATWASAGTLNGPVTDLAIAPDGQLYVAGLFTSVSGTTANGIARWDGTAWHSLGSGLTGSPSATNTIRTLSFDSMGRLYAGGSFSGMSGVSGTRLLARWDGTNWQSAGDPFGSLPGSPEVRSILADGTSVYVGGAFASAAGVSNTRSIAVWNTQTGTWSALGSLPLAVSASNVLDIRKKDNQLFLAGSFTNGFTVSGASNMVGFDLTTGAPFALGDGLSTGTVASLSVQGSDLLAAGEFQFDGPNADVSFAARWDGSQWQKMTAGTGFDTVVRTIEASGITVYAGGDFISGDGNSTPYFAFLAQTALPVLLTSFRAQAFGGQVTLFWETASERNASSFDIQRSTDAFEFSTIGVKRAQGNSQTLTRYSFVDTHSGNEVRYYRLLQRDNDGSVSVSSVVSVAPDEPCVVIFPNPSAGRSFRLLQSPSETKDVRLYDAIGREIPVLYAGDEVVPYFSLPAGRYTLKIVPTRRGAVQTLPLLVR